MMFPLLPAACRRLLMPFFFLSMGVLLLNGCGKSGFQLDHGKPAIVAVNASEGRRVRYIPGADAASFKPLDNADDTEVAYASDVTRVYIAMYNYDAMPVESAHPATFTILTKDGAYTADKDRVYWFGVELAGADPTTFRVVKSPCAVDSQRAYIGITPLEVHSVENFEVLQVDSFESPIANRDQHLVVKDPNKAYVSSWSRDGVAYYWGATELEGADYDSLVLLNEFYAKDKATVYFKGKPIRRADADSFMVVGPGSISARDKGGEFESGQRVRHQN